MTYHRSQDPQALQAVVRARLQAKRTRAAALGGLLLAAVAGTMVRAAALMWGSALLAQYVNGLRGLSFGHSILLALIAGLWGTKIQVTRGG